MAPFEDEGKRFICCEQYMMARKADLFGDAETLSKIMAASDPKSMKSLGRQVGNFNSAIWDSCKCGIVFSANCNKFLQNPSLLAYLLGTGNAILAEASPLDRIWGIGMADGEAAKDPTRWKGENLLGFILMDVRDELRRIGADKLIKKV
jgi:ribA/ribD-fused uncharacterized protein